MNAGKIGAAVVGFGITVAVALVSTVAVLWVAKQFRITRELAGLRPPNANNVRSRFSETLDAGVQF